MKKRIIISVTSDLSTDQRVLKVARSCFANGYEVQLIGRHLKDSKPLNLPFHYNRMKLIFSHSVLFYAEFNIRLFFHLFFSASDIFLSNDTDTLPANYLAARLRRKKLIFDAHELFPEVPELVNRPKARKIWERIEKFIFPHLTCSYTVCDSISEYYQNKYNIHMDVIRNVPYYRQLKDREIKISFPNQKIILYQGALNTGRGLEWVLEAMPYVINGILVIIGDGDIRQELEVLTKTLQIEEKVVFLGKIEAEKLYEYTPSAAIGLCLLEKKGLSYYYALPNRIFDYLQTGVPVLATRFPEIVNIVETYNTGVLIDHYEPMYLSKVINEMLAFPLDTSHYDSIAKNICWENEEKILMRVINTN